MQTKLLRERRLPLLIKRLCDHSPECLEVKGLRCAILTEALFTGVLEHEEVL